LLSSIPLFSDAEFADNGFIFIDIFSFQIIEQTPSLTNQFQEALTGMMILAVGFKMLGQILDPIRKKGNLNFR
jgi:hypothetical protein